MKRFRLLLFLPLLLLALHACGTPVPPQASGGSGSTWEEPLPPPVPAKPEQDAPVDVPPLADLPEDAFVRVQDYLPDVQVSLRYATADNFTGTVIYDFSDAYLRCGTVKKLTAVMDILSRDGYTLLIWDAFRPAAAQFQLWNACPDSRYVADPRKGFSSHSRGNTLDVSLLRTDGSAVEMPTDFDDFTPLADRDYCDIPEPAAANAQYLETVFTECGFRPYQAEWWHFSDTDSYPVDETFLPAA